MSLSRRNRNRRSTRQMMIEGLEKRTVLSISAGFVVDGGALYYDITADDLPNKVVLGRTLNGDVIFEASTDSEIELDGTISTGEISLAELLAGTSFSGFRVQGLGGDDVIDATGTGIGNRRLTYPLIAWGGAGNDQLTGGTNADALYGNEGADALTGNQGADALSGGEGDDVLSGGTGADVLSGDEGDDVLNGDQGEDNLFGGGGDDTLNADRLDVAFSGGSGFDVLNIANAPAGPGLLVITNLDIEDINGSTGNERVDNTNFNDFSTADEDGYVTVSFDGNESAGDNDEVILSSDPLILQEIANVETVSFQNYAGGLILNLNDLGSAVDNLIVLGGGVVNVTGTEGNDTIIGNGAANVINGLGGSDFINAGGGNDSVDGGAGNDLISGGAGSDSLIGGEGTDTILGGADADTMSGGEGDDLLDGGAGSDVINGGAGDDNLQGGSGNDTLDGGDGIDLVAGGTGNDVLIIPYADVLDVLLQGVDGTNEGNTDQYFGQGGNDTFQFVGVPVGTNEQELLNNIDNYLEILSFLSLTDFGFSDTITWLYEA